MVQHNELQSLLPVPFKRQEGSPFHAIARLYGYEIHAWGETRDHSRVDMWGLKFRISRRGARPRRGSAEQKAFARTDYSCWQEVFTMASDLFRARRRRKRQYPHVEAPNAHWTDTRPPAPSPAGP